MQMDHTSHNQAFALALHTSYVLTSLVSIPCYRIFHVALAKGKKICTIAIFMKIRAAEISQELENRVQYL